MDNKILILWFWTLFLIIFSHIFDNIFKSEKFQNSFPYIYKVYKNTEKDFENSFGKRWFFAVFLINIFDKNHTIKSFFFEKTYWLYYFCFINLFFCDNF